MLIKRLKNHYRDSKLKVVKESENSPNDDKNTDEAPDESNYKHDKAFDYVCVIDFEATCTEKKQFDYPHEIIQCNKKLFKKFYLY